jgi:hypothetical protein
LGGVGQPRQCPVGSRTTVLGHGAPIRGGITRPAASSRSNPVSQVLSNGACRRAELPAGVKFQPDPADETVAAVALISLVADTSVRTERSKSVLGMVPSTPHHHPG